MQRHAFETMNVKDLKSKQMEAYIGVYVNESGTLGDNATCKCKEY